VRGVKDNILRKAHHYLKAYLGRLVDVFVTKQVAISGHNKTND
jgi:hypothetical protein